MKMKVVWATTVSQTKACDLYWRKLKLHKLVQIQKCQRLDYPFKWRTAPRRCSLWHSYCEWGSMGYGLISNTRCLPGYRATWAFDESYWDRLNVSHLPAQWGTRLTRQLSLIFMRSFLSQSCSSGLAIDLSFDLKLQYTCGYQSPAGSSRGCLKRLS